VIGLHTHHVTEEIYVVLSGRAEVFSGDARVEIGPGDVAMIGRGGSHGVVNHTDEAMEFLVVEASPPSTVRALYAGDATTPDPDRSALVVEHVEDGARSELGPLLNAPWDAVEFVALAEGQNWTATSEVLEYAVYLIDGTGRLALGADLRDLVAGTALVFTSGTSGQLTAGPSGLRLVSISAAADPVRSAALAAEAVGGVA
jgi:hypothetical protein